MATTAKNQWLRALVSVADHDMLKALVLKVLAEDEGGDTHEAVKNLSPLQVGNKVLIRTVTHYHTGLIIQMSNDEVVLEDAAWIADTGRFYAALMQGELNEIEPFTAPVSVNRGAIIDVTLWPHLLPRGQK